MKMTIFKMGVIVLGLYLSGCATTKIYNEGMNKTASDLKDEIDKLDLRAVVNEARENRQRIFDQFIEESDRQAALKREEKFLAYAKDDRGKYPFSRLKTDIAITEQEIFDGQQIVGAESVSPTGLIQVRQTYKNNNSLKKKAAVNSALGVRDLISHIRERALDLSWHAGLIEQKFGISGLECRAIPIELLVDSDADQLENELTMLTTTITPTILLADKPAEGCEKDVATKKPETIDREKRFFALAGLKRPQELVKLAPQQINMGDGKVCEQPARKSSIDNLMLGLMSGAAPTKGAELSEHTRPDDERRTENAARVATAYFRFAQQCAELRVHALGGLAVLQEAGMNMGLLKSSASTDCPSSPVDVIKLGTTLRSAVLRDNCIAMEIATQRTVAQSAAQALKSAEDSLKAAKKNSVSGEANDSDEEKTFTEHLATVTEAVSKLKHSESVFGKKLLRDEEVSLLELASSYLKGKEVEDAVSKEQALSLQQRKLLAIAKGLPELEAALQAVKKAKAPVTVELEAAKTKANLLSEHATRKVELLLSERQANKELMESTLEAVSLLDRAAENYFNLTEGKYKAKCSVVKDKNLDEIIDDKQLPYFCKEEAIIAVVSAINAQYLFESAFNRADWTVIAIESHEQLLEDEMIAAAHQDLIVVPARVLVGWHASGFKSDTIAQLIVNALGFGAIAEKL